MIKEALYPGRGGHRSPLAVQIRAQVADRY